MLNMTNGTECLFFVHSEREIDVTFVLVCHAITGVFRGGAEVLVRCKLALSEGVHMQLTVRSTDPSVAEIITMAIG